MRQQGANPAKRVKKIRRKKVQSQINPRIKLNLKKAKGTQMKMKILTNSMNKK